MQVEPGAGLLDERYEVREVIGSGGMGRVCRGFDHRLGRDVAIKFLRPDLAADRGVRARFEHEARAAASLSHVAAVTVFDSGESDDGPYLVMECLPGRTLADRLAAGPLPEPEVRQIALDVLGALGAAHALGIVHRDVKPGNILFTVDGRVKLADFGIAKSTEGLEHTMSGQVIGTPAYLAPERLRGEPATPATDLYSLGVVLYEALSGDKPFRGDTPLALVYAIDTTTPPSISTRCPGVDPTFAATIDRALARDQSERFTTAAEMSALLGDAAPGPTSSRDDVHELTSTRRAAVPTQTLPAHVAPDRQAAPWKTVTAWWDAHGRRRQWWLIGLAILLVVTVAWLAATRPEEAPPVDPVTSTTPTPAPPAPLDDAIRELERAVRP